MHQLFANLQCMTQTHAHTMYIGSVAYIPLSFGGREIRQHGVTQSSGGLGDGSGVQGRSPGRRSGGRSPSPRSWSLFV